MQNVAKILVRVAGICQDSAPVTIRTLILSTFLAINSGFAEDLPLPLPTPSSNPMPFVQKGPTSLEKPNLVIRPPGAGVIVVPQVTDKEKQEQAIAEKESQLIDEMLRRQIALAHSPLDGDGALDRIDDAAELGQQAVAHLLEDAAVMEGDFGFEQFLAIGLEALESAPFIPFHQCGVTDHVSGKNGYKLAVHDRLFRPA